MPNADKNEHYTWMVDIPSAGATLCRIPLVVGVGVQQN